METNHFLENTVHQELLNDSRIHFKKHLTKSCDFAIVITSENHFCPFLKQDKVFRTEVPGKSPTFSQVRKRKNENVLAEEPPESENRMKENRNQEQRKVERRKLQELNVIDDFMMSVAASDKKGGEAFCRTLLSTLLERKIGRIQVNAQKVIPALTPELRGIRMDVEVREENAEPVMNLFDLEPCLYRVPGLEKKLRFNQARIDSRYVRSGEKDFRSMPDLYMIMILPYDPFGEDYMVYHVRNRCRELPELDYQDGLEYIYFNTKGRKGGSPEIQRMLRYIENSTEENVKDEAVRSIHRHVEWMKLQPEVKEEYMDWEEKIYYERRDAAEEADWKRRIADILELLEDYGEVPAELQRRLEAEMDAEKLRSLLKLAARVQSLEEFERAVNEEK